MRKKILVIEDEPSIAENITYALATDGFEPVWCGTGQEAMVRLGGGGFALVIVDIGLPDVSGFDLAREIRRTSPIPLIFLTARSDEIDRVAGLELGADDYITKPFSPRELTARVRAILRRAGGNGEAPPVDTNRVAAHFRIDEDGRKISYHGVPLDLTRYEYRLLLHLVKNPGRVYSREQLMDRVWEEPEMSVDRTVDTHVKTLRHKLRAVRPDEDPIVTHRGEGYSLKASR
ncbi:MAG: two-component system response regulator CreB [Nitrospirae bacterium]|nr:two-component system response regulator CreB [Nitrospirota bacterium]